MACPQNQLIQKVFFLLLNFIVFLKQQQAGLKEFIHLFEYLEFFLSLHRVMLERMHDKISNDPNVESYILWRLKDDSTKTSGLPGIPVCMTVVFSNIPIDLFRLNFKLMVVSLVLLNNDNFLNI